MFSSLYEKVKGYPGYLFILQRIQELLFLNRFGHFMWVIRFINIKLFIMFVFVLVKSVESEVLAFWVLIICFFFISQIDSPRDLSILLIFLENQLLLYWLHLLFHCLLFQWCVTLIFIISFILIILCLIFSSF